MCIVWSHFKKNDIKHGKANSNSILFTILTSLLVLVFQSVICLSKASVLSYVNSGMHLLNVLKLCGEGGQ